MEKTTLIKSAAPGLWLKTEKKKWSCHWSQCHGQVLVYFQKHSVDRCKLSLAGSATSIIFVATKVLSQQSWQTCVYRDKTRLLSWQKYACHDKHIFVMTNICCNKHNFAVTKHVFCRDESMLVATKRLQKMCFIATNMCVTTKLLSWQKWYLWQ